MCRGRECVRLGSTTGRVSFYSSLDGGSLRPSGSSSGRNGSVQVFICVIRTLYTEYIWVYTYIVVLTVKNVYVRWVRGPRLTNSLCNLPDVLY
jgi:hypothetical protein